MSIISWPDVPSYSEDQDVAGDSAPGVERLASTSESELQSSDDDDDDDDDDNDEDEAEGEGEEEDSAESGRPKCRLEFVLAELDDEGEEPSLRTDLGTSYQHAMMLLRRFAREGLGFVGLNIDE